MGKNTYMSLRKMLEGSQKVVSRNAMKTQIMMSIGCDERTIKKCFKVMLQTKLVKDIGAGRFEIRK